MRKRIYEVIELSRDGDRLSAVYDVAMILLIVLSLVPLMFKETTPQLETIDRVCVGIFIVDYLLREMRASIWRKVHILVFWTRMIIWSPTHMNIC